MVFSFVGMRLPLLSYKKPSSNDEKKQLYRQFPLVRFQMFSASLKLRRALSSFLYFRCHRNCRGYRQFFSSLNILITVTLIVSTLSNSGRTVIPISLSLNEFLIKDLVRSGALLWTAGKR